MIKAKELRCGNRVQFAKKMQPHGACGDPGPYMTVYGIVEQVKVAQSSILPGPPWEQIWLESFLGPMDPEKLAGIPLTTAILEKCGFVYNQKSSLWYNGIAVRHVPGGITYLYWECSDPYYDEDGITITSVHQLQNLFFALTGEELTYMP